MVMQENEKRRRKINNNEILLKYIIKKCCKKKFNIHRPNIPIDRSLSPHYIWPWNIFCAIISNIQKGKVKVGKRRFFHESDQFGWDLAFFFICWL